MLYRGVCKRIYRATQGEIRPKGTESSLAPRYDGTATYDGRFTHGSTQENAVRAQHINSGTWNSCFVSTSRSRDFAFRYATTDMQGGVPIPAEGVIYWLDEALFDEYGVIPIQVDNPLYPDEMETSIRAADCGRIPPEVIVKVEQVVHDMWGMYRA